jgi:hypothetical protein
VNAFAAIIFHADTAQMLWRCIGHHLAVGVDRIFVSLNLADAESEAAAAAFASERVRIVRVEDYAADTLDYFDAGLRAVTAWAQPDWVMFIDSDEFWIPAGGTMASVAGLDATDVYSVRRFNAPPVRNAGGTIRSGISDPAEALVVAARQTMDAAFLERNASTPWINARIGPKLMVRPRDVQRVAWGAHDFTAAHGEVRVAVPEDLLVVHFPFTTEGRFRRKVDAIRPMLAQHQHRLTANDAWHWKRWLAVADGGGLADEFAAQIIDERDLGELRSRGVLTTPEDLFASRRLIDA